MKKIFTTGEIADLLHIHQTTVIDWANKGLVKTYRTPGGHRRVEHGSLMNFLEEHKMPVPNELLEEKNHKTGTNERPRPRK